MNQPVSEGYSLTIHKSAEENYCVGKSSKILCVKTKNGKESLCVRMHSNGGDVNCKCVSIFSQSWGEWKNVCVSDEQQNGENPPKLEVRERFCHCGVNHGGVCMWVRTDSPATPLPKTITASTTSSHS